MVETPYLVGGLEILASKQPLCRISKELVGELLHCVGIPFPRPTLCSSVGAFALGTPFKPNY